MSGISDGCDLSVNSTTTRPAARASGGTLPPKVFTSPFCSTLSEKANLPSARSAGLTRRTEMTSPSLTSPR